MRIEHLQYLRCPKTYQSLFLKSEVMVGGRIKEGILQTESGEHQYSIVDFIPRFVPQDNYASNFGLEWNTHAKTQYDDESRHQMSEKRLKNETKWAADLTGGIVLEAGSGSGRFTRHVADTGAMVVSFDYSSAVEASYKSNGGRDNVLVVQADIYNMPFEPESFDKVMCIGVLQHTPDPRKSFSSLVRMIKPGGAITVDNYIKDLGKYWLQPKYWVRPFTKHIEPEKLYPRLKAYVDFMWPLACLIRKIPVIGPTINWKLLVADYSRQLPNADDATLKEWAYLDTFDMLSPAYDYPVTVTTFRKWFEEEGLQRIDVHKGYNGVEGRGVKKR